MPRFPLPAPYPKTEEHIGLDFAAVVERTMGFSAHRYMLGWRMWIKVGWVCLSSLSAVQSMTLDVPDGGESCVIITASEGNTINGNYEVTSCCQPLVFHLMLLCCHASSAVFSD